MTFRTTEPLQPRPYVLTNKIQPYEWGSRGSLAFIPNLLGIAPVPDKAYAEMWMGAHPGAPSTIRLDDADVPLTDVIGQFPEQCLGPRVQQRFAGKLPFLLKILSAEKALSIQAHPNKKQAEQLHRYHPEHYPDDNHKPEIAIPLDSLTALVGFKSIADLAATFETYPEIATFIGDDLPAQFQPGRTDSALLKAMFARYIRNATADPRQLAQTTDALEKRLSISSASLSDEARLFLEQKRLYDSADVGLISIFLLNLVHLRQGQAIFLDAGIPHAYIRGNIVECMANSDNVVRAGLTPKYKDVATLVDILTYQSGPVPILQPDEQGDETVYRVPISEFEIRRWRLAAGGRKVQTNNRSPQIVLITDGRIELSWKDSVEIHSRGESLFIPAALHQFSITASEEATVFNVAAPV
ncbi:MAG: mannose-6-phosphate isomerase, class I [Candidatus Zhuqueibacterota bacterium]